MFAQRKHQELSSNYTKAEFPPSQTRENIVGSCYCPTVTSGVARAPKFSARKLKSQTLFLDVTRFDLIEVIHLVTPGKHRVLCSLF